MIIFTQPFNDFGKGDSTIRNPRSSTLIYKQIDVFNHFKVILLNNCTRENYFSLKFTDKLETVLKKNLVTVQQKKISNYYVNFQLLLCVSNLKYYSLSSVDAEEHFLKLLLNISKFRKISYHQLLFELNPAK